MIQTNNFPRIGAPATRALQSIGIAELKQLTNVSEAELLQLHGFASKTPALLREVLKAQGLSFKPTEKGEPPKRKKGSPMTSSSMQIGSLTWVRRGQQGWADHVRRDAESSVESETIDHQRIPETFACLN